MSISILDTLVNTQTTLDQVAPSIAMDADGNFVVAWQSAGQDFYLGGRGIYAQRFDAAGNPVGGEFLVNSNVGFDQTAPSVAMDADGDFVVTWSSLNQDGSLGGVYGQRFNAAGGAQGSEFRVNTETSGQQTAPSVAMDADGNFAVTWQSIQEGSGYGVYTQRYDATGVPQGVETLVNTYTDTSQFAQAVAMDSDGDHVVVWQSYGQDGGYYSVHAQRYDSGGVAQGGEMLVNTTTAGNQVAPAVAMDADGNFVVAWQSNGQDGLGDGVYAQRYNAAGVAQGSEFRANTTTLSNQREPAVAMDADGNFVVTWQSYGQDGSLNGIYAQRYNAAGVAQGGEEQINQDVFESQEKPAVALDADGTLRVVWQSLDLNDQGIFLNAADPLTVTDANISISGATGTGGAYKIGDTVTATWNNSPGGDDNSDITSVTVDFSQFGGGASVMAVNTSNVWTATYTIFAGAVDAGARNVSVTANALSGATATTADTTNASVDTIAPVVSNASISISGASGSNNVYRVGDTVTATWDNSAIGDDNSDTISAVTMDFSAFGGGSAVVATNSSGTWTATYTITTGVVEGTGKNVSVTATDNAGNTRTVADTSNAAVDATAPTVLSIVSIGPNPTNADTLTFSVAFSEVVSNFSTSDFTVSGTTAQIIGYSSGDGGISYNLYVSGGDLASLNGEVTLAFSPQQDITDSAGNALTQVTPSGANMPTYTVDNAPPAVPAFTTMEAVGAGVVFNGTGEAGSTIVLQLMGVGTVGTQVVAVDGTWTTGTTLPQGVQSFQIFALDQLGNQSAVAEGIARFQNGTGGAVLLGGIGGDALLGNVGDDTLIGGLGPDWMNGAGGNDLASYLLSAAAVSVDLSDGTGSGGDAEGDTLTGVENLGGSILGDTLVGDAGANRLDGLFGADLLQGAAGDDVLIGGTGADTLDGGVGNDAADYSGASGSVVVNLATGVVEAEGEFDSVTSIETVFGSLQADRFTGSDADELLVGNAGNDRFIASAGADTLDGGVGFDAVTYGTGEEAADEGVVVSLDPMIAGEGVAGDQVLISIEGLIGTGGDDWLIGRVTGGFGDGYLLNGRGGDDMLDGGMASDILIGGRGSDVLSGGSGNDLADFSDLEGPVTVRLDLGYATAGDDRDELISIENVLGTEAADLLIGEAGENELSGAGGDDTLEGGASGDLLEGGEGRDMASYAHAAAGVTAALTVTWLAGIVLDAPSSPNTGDARGDFYVGIEDLEGSIFADALYGNDEDNLVRGLAGRDVLYGMDGDDTLEGGEGVDAMNGGAGFDIASYQHGASGVQASLAARRNPLNGGVLDEARADNYVSVEGLRGSQHADRLVGSTGTNLLQGLSGADTLEGGDGADRLEGGDDHDRLLGGTGDDVLIGGRGMDTMTGGEGIDTADYRSSAAGLTVDLALGYAGQPSAGDVLSEIENVIGTSLADTLVGDDGANLLAGWDGDDLLVGGAGADTLDGGLGTDSVSYAGETGGILVDLQDAIVIGGSATGDVLISIESVTGTSGDDTLLGDGMANQFDGGAGDDLIAGRGGSDVLEGGIGIDTLSYGSSMAGVVVSLQTGLATVGSDVDTVSGFENVNGGSGNDAITGSALANLLRGGLGDDMLSGAAGNDTLEGAEGFNLLDGGEGNDLVDYSLSEAASVVFRTAPGELDRLSPVDGMGDTVLLGTDTLTGIEDLRAAAGTGGIDASGETERQVVLDLGQGTLSVGDDLTMTITGFEQAIGGDLADSLIGSAAANYLAGGADADTISGLSGDDQLSGDEDDDSLFGGDGNDVLDGGSGDDILVGGAGSDTLEGGPGFDTAQYGASAAAVTVNLMVGIGLGGDAEGDSLALVEAVSGSAFGDLLVGDLLANGLSGGAGADTLVGALGADTLLGGADNDVVFIGMAAELEVGEVIDGGTGIDVIRFATTIAETLVLTNLVTGIEEVRISDFTGATDGTTAINIDAVALLAGQAITLTGNAGANRLTGNDNGANFLVGNGGADTLTGGNLADTLAGGEAADVIIGGAGSDWADYSSSTLGVSVNLQDQVQALGDAAGDALSGIENLIGSAGADFLRGDGEANHLIGGDGIDSVQGFAGNDTLQGGLGADELLGGLGSDTASYIAAAAGVVVDMLFSRTATGEAAGDTFLGIENLEGSGFADLLAGDNLVNSLFGGAGNDELFGNGGADNLYGGTGRDTLTGGLGVDRLAGGSGADLFIVARGDGGDVLADFSAAQGDQLALRGFGAAADSYAEIAPLLRQVGTQVVLDMSGGDRLVFNNTSVASLTTDHFVFG